MTCRWRMKHPNRTLPPPHVALTHISSSLECEIKACAPSGGFGLRPLPYQVNTVCVMRGFQISKPKPKSLAVTPARDIFKELGGLETAHTLTFRAMALVGSAPSVVFLHPAKAGLAFWPCVLASSWGR